MTTVILKDQLVVPSQVTGVYKQQGKRIVKMFLSDSSINTNGRRFAKDAQDQIVQTVLEKPYIIPPFLDHPQRPQPYPKDPNADIALIHKTAKPYEAGVVFDLEKVSSEDNPGYNIFVELTSPFAIKLFDEGILPRFVSSSIYHLDNTEPDNEIRSAVINNVCAVRHPAYGAKARILGMCVGERDECKAGLTDKEKQSSNLEFKAITKDGTSPWYIVSNNPDGTVTLSANMPSTDRNGETGTEGEKQSSAEGGKCDKMQAVEALDEHEQFTFDNSLFKDAEITSSNMSDTTGAIQSETTIELPASGRTIKKDSKGNVISDTKKGEAQKQDSDKETITKKEETKTEETKTEETKDAKANAKGNTAEDKKDNNQEQQKVDEQSNKEPEQIANPQDKLGTLEQEVKQFSNRLSKQEQSTKYYRKKMIEAKIANVSYLKPEQKTEQVARWEKIDIHGEDLDFALEQAYGAQSAMAKVQDREKKSSDSGSSSRQYHEDTDEDSEKTSSNKPKPTITLDLLSRSK